MPDFASAAVKILKVTKLMFVATVVAVQLQPFKVNLKIARHSGQFLHCESNVRLWDIKTNIFVCISK